MKIISNKNTENIITSTCVCGASKQLAREKCQLNRLLSQINIKKEHLQNKEDEII
jgi:hypothetical protein